MIGPSGLLRSAPARPGRSTAHVPYWPHLRARHLLALTALAWPLTVGAHEFSITPVTLVIPGDGSFRAEVGLDADALALGLPLEADSAIVASAMRALRDDELAQAIESAKKAIREDIEINFDGRPEDFEVSFPHHGTAAAAAAATPTVLGALARLSGVVPHGADRLTVRLPPRYKAVSLEIAVPGRDQPYATAVQPGGSSPPYSLASSAARHTGRGVFVSYLALGFTHILPKGLDHILFVLGLYLLSARWRPLLYQVSAFTVAHSVTLGLSMQGVVSLPERWVESLIALSISWVAVENIATSELKPWRIAVVFCFGLLHGLGFAGVLGQLGMPDDRFLAALLSFNLGVEFGQLAVVGIAFGVTARFRHLAGYRRYFVIPCCLLIGGVGLWWSVTRALF